MKAAQHSIGNWLSTAVTGWDRFWFTPAAPHTLCLIRVLAGWMLLYTHLVWALDLENFFGPHGWLAADVAREAAPPFAWSYLWHIESMPLLWTAHIGAIVVTAMLMLGLFTRITSVLAWLVAVSYCHRMSGALFGLDQVTAMMAMYLMVGNSGSAYSLDAWLAKRKRRRTAGDESSSGRQHATNDLAAPHVANNIAIRLMQLHMCVIYLFGGIGKMRGETWWIGNAFWLSLSNYEYQSIDMTWFVHFPFWTALITHVTVFWETFYCVLIWPRWTRPIALALAVFVHGGIALFLGMPTFGIAMLIGNLAFVSPTTIERVLSVFGRRRGPVAAPQRTPAGTFAMREKATSCV